MTSPILPPGLRASVAKAPRPTTVCAETTVLFDELVADKRARQATHIQRIEAEARRLGELVGAYEMTMADATARLERLCDVLDDECTAVPLRLVPLAIGRRVARDAFTDGMERATVRRAS